MNEGFLSIKSLNFKEKVAGIWSKNQGQDAAILCCFNRVSAACSI